MHSEDLVRITPARKSQWKKVVLGEVTRPRESRNHGNNRTSLIYTVVTLKYVVEFILKHLTNLQHYTPELLE